MKNKLILCSKGLGADAIRLSKELRVYDDHEDVLPGLVPRLPELPSYGLSAGLITAAADMYMFKSS